MESKSIFGKHQLMPGNSMFFELDNFNLGIKRENEGWILKTIENEPNKTLEFSEGEYFQTGKSNSLIITPTLTEKPLVFKGSLLNVSPKHKFIFFLKIPIAIQLYFSKIQSENLLCEIPSKRLSDTWFGEPDLGESALALGSDYELNLENILTTPFEAICPVSIINNSSGTLDLQRLIIRSDNLTLYSNLKKMVTSMVQLEYKGQDVLSSAEYNFSKIYNGDKPEVLSEPRNSSGKNLLKINFHSIKNINKIE